MQDESSIKLPPILPNIEDLLKEYLICPERLPIHEYERNQEFWQRKYDISALFNAERAPCGTTLKVQRDINTGKIIDFCEVPIAEAGSNPKNSMSLNRAPAPPSDNIRGDSTNLPFWPGGFPDPIITVSDKQSVDFSEHLTLPPGFKRGLQFEADGFTVISDNDTTRKSENIANKPFSADEHGIINLMNLVQEEQDFLGLWSDNNVKTASNVSQQPSTQLSLEIDETEVLPKEREIPILNISAFDPKNIKSQNTKWAVMIDIAQPVTNFHERIPEMAHEYKFELDTFQKQAILKLEEHCDVFVAAHTSAGKTVVAEYAIALSQKHKTRTIYTSPIKALSNQKYRDFKRTFDDVGLITGDFQINQTGMCLIMTTEILRSMLYYGSEVTRDLEYVIFDEVHYINNAERGYVWEEVLILLPDYVRIILLSATVPNTMEFANWLGRIKQRTVYVISTLQRPIPLQHYLYTGVGGQTRDQSFLLIDDEGNFLMNGYKQASAALETRKKFTSDPKRLQITSFSGLINHLERKDLLPVVAFTFSRSQCDEMSENLRHVNLTTAEEKNKIHRFFEKCMKRLKEPDQKLPQIMKMKEILKIGLGVHHSGILPIVKEIVEMLFQEGLVKVLFATETFAMGVNMPARTVVFNSLIKFDGCEKRELNPAEYIQMAGRAGRRGLDKTGTVIIRCQKELPDYIVLKNTMQGKPQKLESQFRLTYSMLLSLFRTENLNVEHMMSHSFQEVRHVSKADKLKDDLKQTQLELEAELSKEVGEHLQQLAKYYDVAYSYIDLWKTVQPKIISNARVVKELIPGRVLLVNYKNHFNKLGIILAVKKDKIQQDFKVLVLSNQNQDNDSKLSTVSESKYPENWYRMLSCAYDGIFVPDGVGGHEVIEIHAIDITEITSIIIKLNYDLVLKDWEKRQIPRFRDDPPGQSCQQAIQELTKLTNSVALGRKLEYMNPVKDFHIADLDIRKQIMNLNTLKTSLQEEISCTKIANFEEQFYDVFKRKYLEEKLDNLKFLISHRSLELYPEYESRTEVLKIMGYINDEKRVEQKGQMACGMSMNELLITELVFRNTLTSLEPAEIAALLSALVFQVKTKTVPQLTESLEKGQNEILAIHKEITDLESKYNISNQFEDLNFNLVEVIYEWAQGKPFAEIMKLTDVQEGIIVRCIQQLNEILKDVKGADRFIGDPDLKKKMEEASNTIKRDIVFAASLYTQKEAIQIGI